MKKDLFVNGKDVGYIPSHRDSKWWFDANYADAFEVFELDPFYEVNYFKNDHVGHNSIKTYVDHVKNYHLLLTGRAMHSVLEAGCAGGWYTKEFLDQGMDVMALEGSSFGMERTLQRGVPACHVLKHDLRRELQLHKKFDVACCTEVAEHIEPPFSSQLIKTLTDHSDVIWFSFEAPDTNMAHYHHCNEQPAKFWVNIFDFYGFQAHKLPDQVYHECEARATHVFYNRNSDKIINKI